MHCPYFNVNRVVVHETIDVDYQVDSFVIVLCMRGEANVNGVDVCQGETILVPACDNKLHFVGNGTFLTATM